MRRLLKTKNINWVCHHLHIDKSKTITSKLLDDSSKHMKAKWFIMRDIKDNYTNDDLNDFLKSHYLRPENCIITMLTFDTENPSSCGIVQKDKEGRIIEFHEKSEKNKGNCANGALYAFEEDLIKILRNLSHEVKDFSLDVIPLFIGRMFSWHTSKLYMDIGNEFSLKKANLLASLNKNELPKKN